MSDTKNTKDSSKKELVSFNANNGYILSMIGSSIEMKSPSIVLEKNELKFTAGGSISRKTTIQELIDLTPEQRNIITKLYRKFKIINDYQS